MERSPAFRIDLMILRYEKFFIETLVLLCGAWVSKCLLVDPHLFEKYHNAFVVVGRISEQWWADAALLTTAIHCCGCAMAVRRKRPARMRGGWIRAFALTISGTFWIALGIGIGGSDTNTITCVPFALLGALSWLTVCVGPRKSHDRARF